MNTTGYVSLSLATALQHDLDVTANNIANANTAGFKGERVAFDTLLQNAGDEHGGVDYVVDIGSYVDTRQGAITQTGNTFDLALNGDGWLSYRTPEGTTAYGRDGRLSVSSSGELVTLNGAKVLDAGGAPIVIPADAVGIEITEDGSITSPDTGVIAKLGLFDLPGIQSYDRLGAGLFGAPEDAELDILPALDTKVMQGAIEGSNVQPITEITRLLDVQKAYDRATTIMNNEDQLTRDTLRRLSQLT